MPDTFAQISALLAKMGCPVKCGYVGPMGTGMLTFHGKESATRAYMALANAFRVRPPREDRVPTGEVINGLRSVMVSEWRVGIYGTKA